jgi:hypothetical protein
VPQPKHFGKLLRDNSQTVFAEGQTLFVTLWGRGREGGDQGVRREGELRLPAPWLSAGNGARSRGPAGVVLERDELAALSLLYMNSASHGAERAGISVSPAASEEASEGFGPRASTPIPGRRERTAPCPASPHLSVRAVDIRVNGS